MLAFLKQNFRWLLGGFLLMAFSSFGQTYFIAQSNEELRDTFALSHGDFGNLYMIATLTSAAIFPFVGRLVDMMPIARIAVITIIGLSISTYAMSQVNSVVMLGFVLFGLRLFGQGMMTHIAMTAMGRWFAARRGRAVSISALGYNVAEGTLPYIALMTFSVIGWRMGWTLSAALLICIALPLIYVLLRVERTPRSTSEEKVQTGHQWTLKEALHDPVFLVLVLVVMGPSFIGTSILFQQEHLAEFRNWPQDLLAGSFLLLAACTVVSALITGGLVDKFTSIPLLPFQPIPLMLAAMAIWYFSSPFAIFIFMPLLGMSAGMISALVGTVWPEVYGTKNLGAIRSFVMSMVVLGSALGPFVTGNLLDFNIDLPTQFLYMAGYQAFAVLLMIWARHVLQERRKTNPC